MELCICEKKKTFSLEKKLLCLEKKLHRRCLVVFLNAPLIPVNNISWVHKLLARLIRDNFCGRFFNESSAIIDNRGGISFQTLGKSYIRT